MAKLASSTVTIFLFVVACYYSMSGTASAQSNAGNCNNSITNQTVIKKFVKLCAVLSDIQSLISKEDRIANVSADNNQQIGLRAAVEVSKSVQMNICDWMNYQVGGNLIRNGTCSVTEMTKLCTGMN